MFVLSKCTQPCQCNSYSANTNIALCGRPCFCKVNLKNCPINMSTRHNSMAADFFLLLFATIHLIKMFFVCSLLPISRSPDHLMKCVHLGTEFFQVFIPLASSQDVRVLWAPAQLPSPFRSPLFPSCCDIPVICRSRIRISDTHPLPGHRRYFFDVLIENAL